LTADGTSAATAESAPAVDPDDAVDELAADVELAAPDAEDEDDELPLLPQAARAAAHRTAMGARRQLLNMYIPLLLR
jgi:hypothetical protein